MIGYEIEKIRIKKEVIASLTNDAMANVWGGDLVKIQLVVYLLLREVDVGVGNCIPYTQDPNKCPHDGV